MRRKNLVIIVVLLVFIILAVSFTINYYNTAKSSEEQPKNNPPENPEGPEFVIPESHLGTLGLISALAAAFGIFAVAKKRT